MYAVIHLTVATLIKVEGLLDNMYRKMHGERLDFKLDVHLNQTLRQAVLKEISFSTINCSSIRCGLHVSMHDHTV